MALKKHFTTAKYDVFKEPRVKIPEATFLKRNDRFLWDKLAQDMQPKELLDFMVANFLYQNYTFIYDMPKAQECYTKYLKNRGMLTYLFENEVSSLDVNDEGLLNGCPPGLLSSFLGGRVSIETLCILSNYSEFLDDWEVTTLGLFEETIRHIQKARRFIKFNSEKIEKILVEETWLRHEA